MKVLARQYYYLFAPVQIEEACIYKQDNTDRAKFLPTSNVSVEPDDDDVL